MANTRRKGMLAVLTLFVLVCFVDLHISRAQPAETSPSWGGNIWSRPRMTGNWGGLRDELGRKGVTLDFDLLLTPESVLSGGRSTGTYYWGGAEYTLNVDTDKLGLWPGGFLKITGISGFGSNVEKSAATFVPINANLLLPEFGASATGLENATLTQFLSPRFGVVVGKIFTLDSAAGEFAGNYRTQFMNTALVIPMALALVPISAFGGGAIWLPAKDWLLTATVLDPNGTVMSNDLGNTFSEGALIVTSAKWTIYPFGLVGHQSLIGMWSNKSRVSLVQDPYNVGRMLLTRRFPLLANPGPILEPILARYFPDLLNPVQPLNRESSTWAIVYGFDQYLWQPKGDSNHGLGMFFNFGATDGRTNPVAYSYNVGIGAKGIVPGRPNDTFGIGWARTQFSNNFLPLLRASLGLGLDHEDATEIFYNAAITPWMKLGFDLQFIRPAASKVLVKSNQQSNLRTLNSEIVAGLRLYTRF